MRAPLSLLPVLLIALLLDLSGCSNDPDPGAIADASEGADGPSPALCLWAADFSPGCVEPIRLELPVVSPGELSFRTLVVRNPWSTPAQLQVSAPVHWIAALGGPVFELGPGEAEVLRLQLLPGAPPGAGTGSLNLVLQSDTKQWAEAFVVRWLVLACPAASANCDGDWATGCECEHQCNVFHYGGSCDPCPGLADGTPCAGHGLCDDGLEGSGACKCSSGWKGGDCSVDIDECEFDPCHQMAVCDNLPGTFTCACEPGWVGTGFHCSPASCSELDIFNGTDLPATAHGQSVDDFECDAPLIADPDELPRCEFGAWILPECVEP